MGTSDSSGKSVISYFGVSPIKSTGTSLSTIREYISQTCATLAAESGQLHLGFKDATIDGKQGYKCSSEGQPENINQTYVFELYTLLGGPGAEYEYILSTSFPKGNIVEQNKVDRIVSSFRFN